MTATSQLTVQQRIQVRPVSEHGRMSRGGYMELRWTRQCPSVIRLAETGPDDDGEAEFSRDLLLRALNGEPSAEGEVRARLRHLPGAAHTVLSLTVPGQDGPTELAVRPESASAFVRETTDLVPPGEEWRFIDDDIAALFSEAS